MPGIDFSYDHPNYTIIRQQTHSTPDLAKVGMQNILTFRSRVACVVTQITAIVQGSLIPTATVILTLLFNGSIAAILTLEESINQTIGTFTMTALRTLTSFTDRYEVNLAATFSADSSVCVSYEYRIVPGSTFSLAAALA